jgi:hypothetical protein
VKLKFLIGLSLLTISLRANSLEKGFNALCEFDYFKAKKIFTKQLNPKKPAAYFGLATIFSKNNNPFYNLDSASKYIQLAIVYYQSHKKSSNYDCLKIDSLSLHQLKDSIQLKLFDLIKSSHSTVVFEKFLITNYLANPSLVQQLIVLRDEADYTVCLKVDKSYLTKQFIVTHPVSNLLTKAKSLLQNQIYHEQTSNKTLNEFYHFIKNYADNVNIPNAHQAIFDQIKKLKDSVEIIKFINTCPQSAQLNEAWKLLFTECVKVYDNQNLEQFITRYPSFPFKNELLEELALNTKIYLPFKQNDLVGFIDTMANVKIVPEFDAATPFYEGLSVVTKNDSVFFIDKNRKLKFNKIYEDAFQFRNGVAVIKEFGKYCFINRQGQQISEYYEEINEASDGIYVVKKNQLYAAYNLYGRQLFDHQFEKLGDFKNGFAYFSNDGKYGIVSSQGIRITEDFDWVSDINDDNLFIVRKNNKFGIINQLGNIILQLNFDQVIKAFKGIYLIVENGKYGFYNAFNSCFYTGISYEFFKEKPIDYYTNGNVLKLIKANQQAIMDLNGKISIDFGNYDELFFAENNLLKVRRKQKYGFVDRKLNLVLPYKYDKAGNFSDSIAVVNYKNTNYLINTNGKELFSSSYNFLKLSANYYLTEAYPADLVNKEGKLIYQDIISYQKVDNFILITLKNNSLKLLPIETNSNFEKN